MIFKLFYSTTIHRSTKNIPELVQASDAVIA
jgi:hypothetical protein